MYEEYLCTQDALVIHQHPTTPIMSAIFPPAPAVNWNPPVPMPGQAPVPVPVQAPVPVPVQAPVPVPTVEQAPPPTEHMAEQLFIIAKEMLYECKNMIHPDYPDAAAYHKDFEMRWKHASELIDTATKLLMRPK